MGTSSTTRLPLEVLTAIFEQVDNVHDLCHVRAACYTFCAIATPFAFRVLSVIATGDSSKNLGQLFDVPDIVAHVTEVAYLDTGSDRKGRRLKHIRTNAIRELANSFSRVHQLPRLEAIKLVFYPLYDNRLGSDGQGRLAAQASILSALVASFSRRACWGLIQAVPHLAAFSAPLQALSSRVHLPVLHRRLAFRPATRAHLHAARGPRVQAAHPISWSATQRKCDDGDWAQTLVARVAGEFHRPIRQIRAGTCQEWQDKGADVAVLRTLYSYLVHTTRLGVAAGRLRRTGASTKWRTSGPGGPCWAVLKKIADHGPGTQAVALYQLECTFSNWFRRTAVNSIRLAEINLWCR
ncbi:hypothetical protein H4582DRAFT_2130594 [Lactarius indigo]|nr:hypothetical protein H4582DRAFT_2130594 [Lactarius indigo]